jgi:hypothetical protein
VTEASPRLVIPKIERFWLQMSLHAASLTDYCLRAW